MSKKMLKRSLVLGALMAFVITGSAMANTLIIEGGNGESSVQIYNNEWDAAEASGDWSIAIGNYATAEGDAGIAIGYDAVAIGEASVAIGDGSKATEEFTVSFGSSEYPHKNKRLVNIAEGTATTDAVNLGQMNKALEGKANVATTLGGYGITDAYTKEEVNTKLGEKADKTALDAKADKTALDTEKSERAAADKDLQAKIDDIGGNSTAAINGLNQRLDRTNAKINKVGAGAAALAALHPLDYDPDDKLTFSAGMGNYAGENAAALGAFYRPNEKFMVSLGGTMGNGENMVNLGLSIGLDKPNGLAKLSKRELIQKVNAVEAENDALEDRVAKLEALVAQLASK
ncbi:MAG: YadA-like family protein [Acidaminococcaceae bacterium]|nr:YadA-like family protein [Acidaminococcaceae bacterium]